MSPKASIYIGYDPREAPAFAVAKYTCRRQLNLPIPIYGLVLSKLMAAGLYRRPMEFRSSESPGRPIMWDVISDAPQSTEHANSRFLVPYLARSGWALFCDGDMLFRSNITGLFENLDEKYAVYCVKHDYAPTETVKMDGQIQTQYSRKNWSSFMLFNVDHSSNNCLRYSVDMANTLPGRDLHRFCWLEDDEIGGLDEKWNFLVGHSDLEKVRDPKVVHFTTGVPDMEGYQDAPFADEWRRARDAWAE
jgi:hypothetical protein